MQLHLDSSELKLVADILLARASRTEADEILLNKILTRDLRLDGDELERLGEVLAERERELKAAIAQKTPADSGLQERLALLRRAKERINEACVMF